ncbi:UvrD-helicase domain-containing protein [Mycoplasmopsis caviae]|uniref:DNA 3'-5' helicase n=1 Tax=Mycoplasmopsis caviae TaxID=55603 RepID=A0A3P8LBG3_9BACT|nr:UvrD-helicase domain-containing protein [Mycoplasmopsis caviae]UUD34737.1 UvrD-helicase domain-containing protein [Mycoplasmopsis caviae]VDR42431.1 ATP-dependent DNA helicase UvrD/PcrA [Mycoplasmopsis caviae]
MSKKDEILNLLNNEQKEALLYFDGPLRIIAGAGSGKTRVLTRKVAYLINELGISPRSILAVTFTNKAANEMSERVRQYVGEQASQIDICTFHSLSSKILRKEAIHVNLSNDFQIIDETDKKSIINQICKTEDISNDEISFKDIMRIFSWAKNQGFSADEMVNELNAKEKHNSNALIGKLYERYNQFLENKKCLDFDDLIIKVKELFDNFPEVAKIWSKKYSYILVDEFQDTSSIQYDIVKYLSTNAQLTIVGDPDQTIYGWRGADVNLILDFDKDFKDTKTVILNTNYRSSKVILNAANKLIKHNKKRFSKDLITNREEDGAPIEFIHAFSVEAEARWVVQKINELKKQKIQLKNIAIFYRSNYYSRPFEEELINENINHKIFNGQKFFQRSEIKDALAFLRVIYDGSDVSLNRIINVPNRKIGEATLKKLQDAANSKNLSLYSYLIKYYKELPVSINVKTNIVNLLNKINKYRQALKNNQINVVLDSFLKEIGYYEHIEEQTTLHGTAKDNVAELIRSIVAWENKNPDKKIKEYLESVSLLSAGDEYDNSTNYVTLMTVHSAKGLEFDNIFLVGMSDQIFPNYKSLNSNHADALEEERRLAYVAITRARNKLFISDSRGYLIGTNNEKKPSRFIREMGIDLKKFILQDDIVGVDFDEIVDEKQIKAHNKKIIAGDIVSHSFFGEGEVVAVESDTISVKFTGQKAIRVLAKNHYSIRLLKNTKK